MNATLNTNYINKVVNDNKKPCPNCGCLNDADSVYCESCGTPMGMKANNMPNMSGITCPDCGAINKNNARFCSKCGRKFYNNEQPINEEKPPRAKKTYKRVDETIKERIANINISQEDENTATDYLDAFANGLPNWDIVPPITIVRRK